MGTSQGDILLLMASRLEDADGIKTRLPSPALHVLDSHEGVITCHVFSPTSHAFATGAWDGCVRYWTFDVDDIAWSSLCLRCHDFDEPTQRIKVTALCFNCTSSYMLAASSIEDRHSIRVCISFISLQRSGTVLSLGSGI